LPAEEAGVLKTLAKEGDTLNIGDVACQIDTAAPRPAGKAQPAPQQQAAPAAKPATQQAPAASTPGDVKATPVAAAVIADKKVDPASIKGSGAHGKIMKDDVFSALSNPGVAIGQELFTRNERREKMSNLRKTVSRRLVEAKNTTAMLTTFNEVDMTNIMAIRSK